MDLLTTADLAKRWRTTEQAVYAARHRGDCPRAVRLGKRLLWRLQDVEAWEEARAERDESRRVWMEDGRRRRARHQEGIPRLARPAK